MAMLKPKQVLPLLSGVRAALFTGANQGPQWQASTENQKDSATSSHSKAGKVVDELKNCDEVVNPSSLLSSSGKSVLSLEGILPFPASLPTSKPSGGEFHRRFQQLVPLKQLYASRKPEDGRMPIHVQAINHTTSELPIRTVFVAQEGVLNEDQTKKVVPMFSGSLNTIIPEIRHESKPKDSQEFSTNHNTASEISRGETSARRENVKPTSFNNIPGISYQNNSGIATNPPPQRKKPSASLVSSLQNNLQQHGRPSFNGQRTGGFNVRDPHKINHKSFVQGLSSTLNELQVETDKFGLKGMVGIMGVNSTRTTKWRVEELNEALRPWSGKVNQFHVCDVLKQMYDPQLAKVFFQWAQEQPQFKHDIYIFTTLMGIFGRAKDTAGVQWVLDEMKKKKCSPTIVTYNRLIHIYGKANMLEQALQVKEQMEKDNIEPDYVTHSTMLNLYSNAGLHDKAAAMFEEMKSKGMKPDEVVYTMLLNSYGRSGDLSKAAAVLEEMRESKVPINPVTWNSIICLYGRAGRTHEAMSVFREMLNSGEKPNVLTYSVLIDLCGKKGMMEEAEMLFSQVLEDGLVPDSVSWNSMVLNYGRLNQPTKAASWFRKMLDAVVTPSVPCFNTLIFAFLRVQMYAEAKIVFQCMRQRGLTPTLNTYLLLLSTCTDCNDQFGTELLLELMDESGHPAHEILQMLVHLKHHQEDQMKVWENVRRLWDGLRKEVMEDQRAFSDALITFLVKSGLEETAGKFWLEARARNVWPMAVQVKEGELWQLDLHRMSEATARIVTFLELGKLGEKLAEQNSENDIKTAQIVTGWGRRSKVEGTSSLKKTVEEVLREINSPFQEAEENPGMLSANGEELKAWLLSSKVKNVLTLSE